MRVPRFFAAPSLTVIPPQGEAGADADTYLNRFMAGAWDDNAAWSGTQRFWTADEMARTDPTVKSILHFLGLPVRAANWGLTTTNNDGAAQLVRDACAWQFGMDGSFGPLDMSWDELNQQALRMLIDGAVLEELVWASPKELQTWRDAEGMERQMLPLVRVAPRPATSILRVIFDRGRVTEVVQNLPGTFPIPGEKISHLVWERIPGRWHGESLLRPAWGSWYSKKQLLVAFGIAWDRFATSIPVMYHPATADAETRAKQITRNLRLHESASVNLPGHKGDDWELDLIQGSIADPVPALQYFSEQIAEVGMQQFTRQGLGQVGSRAAALVQVDPYFLAVQMLADYIAERRRTQLMYKFVEVNFPRGYADLYTPHVTVSKIQGRNLQVISAALEILVPLGLTLTTEDIDDLREELGFGKLPDDGSLEAKGVDRQTLIDLMRRAGIDSVTLAKVVEALAGEGFGVARNTVPPPGVKEGSGLPVAA